MYNDVELHMLVKAGNDINKVYSNEVYNPIQIGTIPMTARKLPKRIALGGKHPTKRKRTKRSILCYVIIYRYHIK